MDQQLLSTIIQFSSCTALLFAVLLWMQRKGNRSRIYFSVAYLICGIDLFMRTMLIYSGTPLTFEALQPGYLSLALIELPLFLFYLLEVVNPDWLTWRRIGLLCSPWLLWNLCMLIPGLHFRELNTFEDLSRHIGEVNVWLRLLFVLLTLSYSTLIYYIPYNWRRSSADRRLIRIYGGGFFVLTFLFSISSISGSMLASSLHLAYGLFFCFCLAYYELFLRLDVPHGSHIKEDIQIVPEVPATQDTTTTQTPPMPEENETLWKPLCAYMQEEEPWRNPDLTIVSLAEYLNTNRTTLSTEIHTHGYTHLSDFISAYRIKALCDMLDRGEAGSMDDAFFEVGYRSRSTAFDSFKKHTGCTPRQYLKMNPQEKKSIKQKMK